MARPTKQGLDYFALDVNMNDEVEIIEAEHGLVGFSILIKLFQKIYSEGYYYQWNDREKILFSNRVSVDRNLLSTIVDSCIEWGIFDKGLYEQYSILTSKRIQNHYFIATYKRVDVEAIKEYLLIDVSDRNNVVSTRVSVDSNKDVTRVTDVESTQSKVEESILKEKISNDVDMHYMKTLLSIKDYPFDIDKDIKNLETLTDRYPTLDIVQAINKFYDFILERPFESNAKHRGQLNNSFKMYNDWPNFKKKADISKIETENPFAIRG